MKKWLIIIPIIVLFLLVGCNKESSPPDRNDSNLTAANNNTNSSVTATDDVIEIKEKMFIAQSNDIYLNSEDYIGKTIKYEGLFESVYWEEDKTTYNFVIRYGPGCCGDDGKAGFEVIWDGEWPQANDWCEVIGTLESYDLDGFTNLRLRLTSLTVLDKRGAEFVAQ